MMNLIFTLVFFTAAFIVFAWKKEESSEDKGVAATPHRRINAQPTHELHVDAVTPEPAFPLMKATMQSVA